MKFHRDKNDKWSLVLDWIENDDSYWPQYDSVIERLKITIDRMLGYEEQEPYLTHKLEIEDWGKYAPESFEIELDYGTMIIKWDNSVGKFYYYTTYPAGLDDEMWNTAVGPLITDTGGASIDMWTEPDEGYLI